MGFLVAEVAIMLIAAALAGATLTYWWVRHRFTDASSLFQVLQTKLAATEEALEHARTAAVTTSSAHAEAPVPAASDVARFDQPLNELRESQNARIRAVEGQLRTLSRQLQDVLPHRMDAEDLARRLDTLRAALPQPRLGVVESRLNRLEAMITAVCEHVGAAVPPPSPYSTPPEPMSYAPPAASKPASSSAPAPFETDTSSAATSPSSDAPKPRVAHQREPGSNLLHKPSYGPPDNLKRISGIGPKLENLLHRVGVYYYWQVAEWTPADISYVDKRLEGFKGRIRRDGWIAQAKRFAAEPNASVGPNIATSRASSIRSLDNDPQQSTG